MLSNCLEIIIFFKQEAKRIVNKKSLTQDKQPALLKEIWRFQARNTPERILCFLPKWDCISWRVEPLSHCFYGTHKPKGHGTVNYLPRVSLLLQPFRRHMLSFTSDLTGFLSFSLHEKPALEQWRHRVSSSALSSPNFPSPPVLGPVLQGYKDYSTCDS